MKLIKQATIGLAALGLLAAATSSLAEPILTYTTDGYGTQTVDPFGGFDWNSAGSAVTTGYDPIGGSIFTTEFWADAVTVKRDDGSSAFSPLAANGFDGSGSSPFDEVGAEFTIQAFINETAVCTNLTCTSADFTAVGGTFKIWYEGTADADLVTGAGITDGTLVLEGNILPGFAGSFDQTGTGGTGSFTFRAMVTSTNSDFIDPDLVDSLAVSTIQFGTSVTDWTQPTSTPSGAIAGGALIFQADANQTFSIPEPGMLAILSLGLFGLAGLNGRRRSQS